MSGGRNICLMGRNIPRGVAASFLLIPLALPRTNQHAKQCMQIPPYTPSSSSKIVFGEFLFILAPLSSLGNHRPVHTAGGKAKLLLLPSGTEGWMPRTKPQACVKARGFISPSLGAALHLVLHLEHPSDTVPPTPGPSAPGDTLYRYRSGGWAAGMTPKGLKILVRGSLT